jgi:hypothetical protein
MQEVSVEKVQNALQKTITWPKKLGKGRQEWELAYKKASLRLHKLKILIKT